MRTDSLKLEVGDAAYLGMSQSHQTKHLSAWFSDVSEWNKCIVNSNFQCGAFTAYLE